MTIRAESVLNDAKAEFKQQPLKKMSEHRGEASKVRSGHHQDNTWAHSGKVNSVPAHCTPRYQSSVSRASAGGRGVSYGASSFPTCTHCGKRHDETCSKRGERVYYTYGQPGHFKRECPMTAEPATTHSAPVGLVAPSGNQRLGGR